VGASTAGCHAGLPLLTAILGSVLDQAGGAQTETG
jgi:hypothetical protein